VSLEDFERDLGFTARDVAEQELLAKLHENRDLSEDDLQRIADLAGRSLRQVYRWKAKMLATLPEPEPDPTPVLFRLIETGDKDLFEFDELMVAMCYAVGRNFTRLHDDLERAGVPVPSLSTFSRKWDALPPLAKDGAKNGLKNRTKHLLYVRRGPEDRPEINTFWHYDATVLDVWVLGPDGEPCKPHWTEVVDAGDAFCTGWMALPKKGDSADVKAFLAAAVEVRPSDVDPDVDIGGLPDTFVMDNAGEYTSEETVDALAALGRIGRAIPIATPTANGVVERNIGTLQRMIVTGISGQVTKAEGRTGNALSKAAPSRLLSWDAFVEHCRRCVRTYNYELIHSALGCTPFELRRQAEHLVELPIDELAPLWKPVESRAGVRKVHGKGGVKLTIAGNVTWFNSEELDELNLIDEVVRPRKLHHDDDRLALFDEHDRFLCLTYRKLDARERGRIVAARMRQEREVLDRHRVAENLKAANTDGVEGGAAPNIALAALRAAKRSGSEDVVDLTTPDAADERPGKRVPPTEEFGARQPKKKGRGPARGPSDDEIARRSIEMAAEKLGLNTQRPGTGDDPETSTDEEDS
jgi:transposase InsO family protein